MNSPSPFTPIQAIQDEQREGWVAESKPTPRVNRQGFAVFRLGEVIAAVPASFARQLERELSEKDAQIAQLQSERENWRVSSVCRDMKAERDEAYAQILALRTAQSFFRDIVLFERGLLAEENSPVNAIIGELDHAFAAALSTPPPPVVPLEDVKPLVQAAQTLKDAKGRYNTGIAYERFLEAVNQFTTKHPTTK